MQPLTENGIAVFRKMMGERAGDTFEQLARGEGLIGDMARLAADFAFGSVWSRQGLTPAQRSLVTLGILIAQSQAAEIKNHFRIALQNGVSPRELEELVLHTVPYAGFPAAATATTALIEVLRETGEQVHGATPEESGML